MPAHPDTYARFYLHPQPQSDGSTKDKVYVEISIKGVRNTSYSQEATKEDKENYPKAWAAYQTNNSFELSDGHSITALPGIGPSMALQLKTFGIFSVEDLAELGEPGIYSIPGGRTMKKKAQAYLAALAVEDEKEETPEPVNEAALSSNPEMVRTERKKPGPKPKNRVEEDEAA